MSRRDGQAAGDALHHTPSSVLEPVAQEELRRLLRLSPREFRIALCLMDGLPRKAIARRLGCSPHTVDSHMRRIFRKLGVRNRAGVVGRLFVAYAEWTKGARDDV